jgi:anti-sigma B factor antagonist
MPLPRDDTRRPGQQRARAPVNVGRRSAAEARGDPAPQDPATLCACTVSSVSLSAGDIVVLRVAGEIDLGTDAVLRCALDAVLDQQPAHLVVDLAELRFCSARGMSVLVAAAVSAAAHGTQYAVSGAPGRITRFWSMLWPVGQLPVQFPTTVAAVLSALADQAGPLDRTRPQARSRTRCGLVSATERDTYDRSPSTDRAVIAEPTVIIPPTMTAEPGPVHCPG